MTSGAPGDAGGSGGGGRRYGSPYPESSWNEYRRLVVEGLDRLEKQNEEQNRTIAKLERDVAVLSTRIMLFSAALAALVSAGVELAAKLIR